MFGGLRFGLGWALGVAALVAVLCAPMLFLTYQPPPPLEEFTQRINLWMAKPKFESDSAYVRGKVLPIIHKTATNDRPAVEFDVYEKLPNDLRPATPDEVGTVLWIDWDCEYLYDHTVAFERCVGGIQTCKVTLIDKRADKRLASKSFRGNDPTQGPGPHPFWGERPVEKIVDYVARLPRKGG
jgi:hypothetical protein